MNPEFHERIAPNRTVDKVRMLAASEITSTHLTKVDAGNENQSIKKITVSGILSFGSSTIFELGNLNILIGPNGTGKSNLIDCIRLIKNSTLDVQQVFSDSGFENWLFKGFDAEQGYASIETILSNINGIDDIRHELRFSPSPSHRALIEEVITSGGGLEDKQSYFIGSYKTDATLSYLTSAGRRRTRKLDEEFNHYQSILSQVRDISQYPEITRLAKFYNDSRIYSEWNFGRKSNLRESASANAYGEQLSETMDNLALVLNGLFETETHEKIRLLLSELKESYADYFTRSNFGRIGLFIVENSFSSPIPAQRLSDGTLKFLALAAILLQSKPPPLICLEEPELGMHPDMIRMLGKMIVDASKLSQIIVTTHSELLLNSLQDDFDTLFAFDFGKNGSDVRKFTRDAYSFWLQENTLGELWTSGELGANRW